MAGPFNVRLWELFAQLEATFGTSPGALAGTDAFKANTANPWTRNVARFERDREQGNRASVPVPMKGKESSSWTIPAQLYPSGNAATPTECDMDVFYEAHLGAKHKATAHGALTTGSTATVINLTGGGAAAMGIVNGDMIMVDVSAVFGMEAREITNITVDAVTVAPALSAAPASGRAVYSGTTYRLNDAALKTLHLWGYLDGNNFRHKTGGNTVKTMAINCDFSSDTPIAEVTFGGDGKQLETHATSRPTAVTAGEPLLPSEAKVFIGASGVLCVTSVGLSSDNGLELRQNESCSLFPTGAKRTGNNSNFNITQDLEMLLLTGTVEGYYDAASALTAYDVTVQLGVTVGKTVAWRTQKFVPEVNTGDQGGEVSVAMSGRVYSTGVANTELVLAFL